MAYESGQYINEFLNEMPTLLLTMRKMDVDQMLATRKLDQADVALNLDQQKFDFDSLIRDRQMRVMEAESGRAGELFAEQKRGREAQKKMMLPIHQAIIKEKKLAEAMEKERSELSWWDRVSRIEKRGEGWGTLMSREPGRFQVESEQPGYGLVKKGELKPWQLTEEELVKSRAEESLGVKPEDILKDKFIPSGATQFEQMLEAGGGNLFPGSYDYMMQHPIYGPKMSTNPELLDLIKSGLMSQAGPLALTQGQ